MTARKTKDTDDAEEEVVPEGTPAVEEPASDDPPGEDTPVGGDPNLAAWGDDDPNVYPDPENPPRTP